MFARGAKASNCSFERFPRWFWRFVPIARYGNAGQQKLRRGRNESENDQTCARNKSKQVLFSRRPNGRNDSITTPQKIPSGAQHKHDEQPRAPSMWGHVPQSLLELSPTQRQECSRLTPLKSATNEHGRNRHEYFLRLAYFELSNIRR